MNFRFITDRRNMLYSHYLAQPQQMIDWVLNKNLHENPELIKTFENISHPLIRKYRLLLRDRVNGGFADVINNVCVGICKQTTSPSVKNEYNTNQCLYTFIITIFLRIIILLFVYK